MNPSCFSAGVKVSRRMLDDPSGFHSECRIEIRFSRSPTNSWSMAASSRMDVDTLRRAPRCLDLSRLCMAYFLLELMVRKSGEMCLSISRPSAPRSSGAVARQNEHHSLPLVLPRARPDMTSGESMGCFCFAFKTRGISIKSGSTSGDRFPPLLSTADATTILTPVP